MMLNKKNSQNTWILLTWMIIATLLLSACTAGQKTKVYHVGILSGSDAFVTIADGFKARMTELGYVEGENIIYDFQETNNDRDAENRVAQQFVDEGVDLIFAFPTDPALAAKAATQGTNIPVIFAHAGLEGSGLVDSVRNPGGNLSGTRFPGPDLVVKRFDFLLKIDPSIQRLYIPYDKNYPNCAPALAALRPAAKAADIELVELPVTTLDEVQADLQARSAQDYIGIDGILLLPELLMQSPDGWALISTFAAEQKIPLVGSSDRTVTTGGVLSYNVNPVESGMLAATIADKALQGIQIGTIPIITPDAYLRVNYKLAQELELIVPDSVLRQATEIIRDDEAAVAAPATQAPIAASACTQPIKIAIIGAMTGTNAVLGKWMKQGVTLAIEQKNAAGGVQGCQIELVIYDDEADATKSVSLAQKVVTEDQVMAAWATTNSGTALADLPTFTQYKIPQFTNGTNATITQQGSAYIFRVNPAGPAYEDPIVKYLVNQGKTRFAIINDDSAYGKGEATYQTTALQRESLEPLIIEEFGVDEQDFTEQLTRIFQTQPQVLLLAASEVAGGLVAKQARELGFTGIIAGGSAMSTPTFLETAGDAAEGVLFTSPYPGNDANEQARAFAAAYRTRWGEDPELHGANTYDGTNMLLIAMENASPLTPENVAAEMHKICGYQGLQGIFCYDENGEGIKTTHLGIIVNGQLTYSVP